MLCKNVSHDLMSQNSTDLSKRFWHSTQESGVTPSIFHISLRWSSYHYRQVTRPSISQLHSQTRFPCNLFTVRWSRTLSPWHCKRRTHDHNRSPMTKSYRLIRVTMYQMTWCYFLAYDQRVTINTKMSELSAQKEVKSCQQLTQKIKLDEQLQNSISFGRKILVIGFRERGLACGRRKPSPWTALQYRYIGYILPWYKFVPNWK